MGTKVADTRGIGDRLGESATTERPLRHGRRIADLLNQRAARRTLFLAGDALALVASYSTAEALVQHFLRAPGQFLNPRAYVLFYLPFLLAVLYLFERNQSPDLRRPERELELVVKSVSFSFVFLVCANFVFLKSLTFSRYLMLTWFFLALVALLAVRFGQRAFYAWLRRHGLARRRTLVIGSLEKLLELRRTLSVQRYDGHDLVGFVPAGDGPSMSPVCVPLPVLGSPEQWEEVARENRVDQIIVCRPTISESSHRLVLEILRHSLAGGMDVQVYSETFVSCGYNYELDDFSGFFRFFAAPQWSRRAQRAVKVSLDALAGVLGSLLTMLATPVIGALIILEDGGPIFYRSAYVGPNGEDHYLLKFRSMRVDADRVLKENPELRQQFERQYKLRSDPRVTRVGRFLRKYSLDEFPSFFNILRGDISLVGPRTIMREQRGRYGLFLPKLFSVKPGLTGFWQVMGRQLTTHEERVQMDMFYIDHWSMWLDLIIIGKTLWKVLRAEGAY